jgi:hypothetical protein
MDAADYWSMDNQWGRITFEFCQEGPLPYNIEHGWWWVYAMIWWKHTLNGRELTDSGWAEIEAEIEEQELGQHSRDHVVALLTHWDEILDKQRLSQ